MPRLRLHWPPRLRCALREAAGDVLGVCLKIHFSHEDSSDCRKRISVVVGKRGQQMAFGKVRGLALVSSQNSLQESWPSEVGP